VCKGLNKKRASQQRQQQNRNERLNRALLFFIIFKEVNLGHAKMPF
jgi:hypothetical protein